MHVRFVSSLFLCPYKYFFISYSTLAAILYSSLALSRCLRCHSYRIICSCCTSRLHVLTPTHINGLILHAYHLLSIQQTLGFFTDPIYQLGENAQAATKAAQQGVSYFTVAGNRDDLSYETIFKATPCKCDQTPPPPTFAPTQFFTDAPTQFLTQFPTVTGFPTQFPTVTGFPTPVETNKCVPLYKYPYVNCVDFGNGSDRQYFHIEQGGNYTLFWDEPWGSISGGNTTIHDFDIYLWSVETGVRVSSAVEANAGISALEEIVIDNPGDYYWVMPLFQSVDNVTGVLVPPIPTNLRLKWIANGGSITDLKPGELDKPTLNHHGNAPLVAAVAAASTQQAFGQLLHEPSTALGGIPLLFDTNGDRYPVPLILERPQFTGPDAYVCLRIFMAFLFLFRFFVMNSYK